MATSIIEQHEIGWNARVTRSALGPLAVFVVVALVTRAIWFGDPVADFDEQIYSLIGWRMTYGELPFVEVWDRKPFGLFAIFALAFWLFGTTRIVLAWLPDSSEHEIYVYLVRLAVFALILLAVLDKNRPRSKPAES